MKGFVAVTDPGWFEQLAQTPGPKDANFWRPSARAFHLESGTPFFFKLKARRRCTLRDSGKGSSGFRFSTLMVEHARSPASTLYPPSRLLTSSLTQMEASMRYPTDLFSDLTFTASSTAGTSPSTKTTGSRSERG
jgi:hypothetical protein